MDESQFAARIEVIRTRFAARLADNMHETASALSRLTGDSTDAVDAVAQVYRRFHDVCGVGPTIGFDETGRTARVLDTILIGPFREGRALSAAELASFTEGLASLQTAAGAEIQSMSSHRELKS